jgi:hypothetical protein
MWCVNRGWGTVASVDGREEHLWIWKHMVVSLSARTKILEAKFAGVLLLFFSPAGELSAERQSF